MHGWAWQGVPSVTSQRATLPSCAFWQTFSEKLSHEIAKLIYWIYISVDLAQCETSDSFQSSCPPATG